MSRSSSLLIIKNFPKRLKEPLERYARRKSVAQNRRVSVAEVAINAINAFVDRISVEEPELLRAAVFTWRREHDLILEAVGQGCVNVEQLVVFVNRALSVPLNNDAIEFLLEDLIGARHLKWAAQGKAGKEDANGNVEQRILVRVNKK